MLTCPIVAVQTVGTYWWHAHRSEQYTDGLYGALITHAPDEAALATVPYPPTNEAVLLLSDMYNTEAMALQWRFTAIGTGIDGQPGDEPVPDGGWVRRSSGWNETDRSRQDDQRCLPGHVRVHPCE